MDIRIPWRVRTATYLAYQYCRSLLSRLRRRKANGLSISIYCGYHQITGSSVAISCIANELAPVHNVDAYIKPQSGYTRLLNLKVRQYLSPDQLQGNLILIDIELENDTVTALINKQKKVVLTCHAFPESLHCVPQPKLIRNLELSTHIHFVSQHQQSEFISHYPEIDIEGKSFVIPNYTRKSEKHNLTGNIGIVGHSNREEKNSIEAIKLAQASNARQIQCWGANEVFGLAGHHGYSKLQMNGWNDDLRQVHSSFDVLLSTSHYETFGLVVVEALSAGIPCVLSDIPVFRELYSACRGVVILSGDTNRDIDSINELLDNTDSLKEEIISFWSENFSNETVKQSWLNRVKTL